MIDLYHKISVDASKNITQLYSTSFSMGIKLLDKNIHDAIFSIYGFVRLADEIVDTFHDYPKSEMLQEFKEDTYKALERKISVNPILHAFQMVVNRYSIDRDLIDKFLQSMEQDLNDILGCIQFDLSYCKVTFSTSGFNLETGNGHFPRSQL